MNEELTENLLKIIANGESTTVEFKEAKNTLPTTLFETVCSMLNRNGGHIFLGIKDNGEIIGVYKDYVKEILKEEGFNNIKGVMNCGLENERIFMNYPRI